MSEPDKLLDTAEARMKKTVDVSASEIRVIRTGKASIGMLDGIAVEAYGTTMPINQLATLAAPDPTMITIKPFDRSVTQAIERAVQKADIGINPVSDGEIIRLPIPPLSEDRRKKLARKVAEIAEAGKTALRNIRRETNDAVKALEKAKKISEDQMHASLKETQELVEKHSKKIEELQKAKEAELLER